MIAVLDACVLYPDLVRRLLLAGAAAGLMQPRWSARIVEEWRRAAVRNGASAQAAIAEAQAAWPDAEGPAPDDPALWLPDPADVHVLSAARAACADTIVTFNLRDFPRRDLAHFGVEARHPDAILQAFWLAQPEVVEAAVETAVAPGISRRAALKRARLPRLAKAFSGAPG